MYHLVKNEVEKNYSDVEVEGIPKPGRTGCFEVTVKDQLIHSKLKGDGRIDITTIGGFLKKLKKVIR